MRAYFKQRRRGSITEYVSDLESDSTSVHNGDHSLPNTPRSTNEPTTNSPTSKDSSGFRMFNKMLLENALHFHKGQEITYSDFVPKFLTSNSIEPLDAIITRVNNWIERCESHVKILNIETIIVPLDAIRTESNIQAVHTNNHSSNNSNVMAEFVRVWIDGSAGIPEDWPGRIISSNITLPRG